MGVGRNARNLWFSGLGVGLLLWKQWWVRATHDVYNGPAQVPLGTQWHRGLARSRRTYALNSAHHQARFSTECRSFLVNSANYIQGCADKPALLYCSPILMV